MSERAGGRRVAEALEAVVWDAGARAVAEWAPLLEESFSHEETRESVTGLVHAVLGAMGGEAVTVPAAAANLTRFLHERIADAIPPLLEQDPRLDKQDSLQVLAALGEVRRALEPVWDRYFAAQMSGPDGLGLVTEVAHDFRSPLTSIRCLAEVLERGTSGPVTELQQKQLRLIYSAALGLSSMATDVIEMARRGDQLVDAAPAPFSVTELIEDVSTLVRPIAAEKGVELVIEQSATADQRNGMHFALARVLLNLLTNALKFTDDGRVELRVRPAGLTRLEFSVLDSGRGIPDEAVADLFKPFRRASSRQGRSGYLFSGTGLGLALCRKLLRSMGSDLQFSTMVGQGTRFFFEVDLPPARRI